MKPAHFYALLAAPLAVLAATQFVTLQRSVAGEWLYPLLIVNAVLIVLMLVLVVAAAARFWRRWRRGGGGSRLASRLAGLFLAIAFLPAGALYLVSAHGVFRGIESWFETPLGDAFEKGEEFGKHVLGLEFARLGRDARNLARALDGGQSLFWRDDLQLLYRVDDIVIYDSDGVAFPGFPGAVPLSAPALKDLRRGRTYLRVAPGAPRRLEVTMRLPHRRGGYALKVSRALPEDIDEGVAEVERGRREYQNLLILRRGLLYSFMATLTLAFVIVLAVSLWASMRLGASLFRPLTRMARAATAVGRGDFSRRLPAGGREDEIAQLSRAFNAMVDDLQSSRRQIGERQAALAEANAYLENLLASMTSGVLAVDAGGKLARFNDAAESILGAPMTEIAGKHFSEWKMLPQISEMIGEIMGGGSERLERRLPLSDGRTLVVRLRRLPPAGGGGALVMADDISGQMETEREMVWEEASRRFAHEIRNPLTPIQLASDRMQAKLAPKLSGEDRRLLSRLSTTIANQVRAMREMVDAFRLYAGEKSRRNAPLNINAEAAEIAQLYERPRLELRTRWCDDMPPIHGDPVLLRQALHNLLGNAAEAAATAANPRITVATARRADGATVLTVEDNGGGVAEEMRDKIFKPYQTTKERGVGLGLVIVRKIMEEHGGEARLENTAEGARASLVFPPPPPEK
ncbi:MAG: ATP-binding protein [Gammaproteobacteria bacterium]